MRPRHADRSSRRGASVAALLPIVPAARRARHRAPSRPLARLRPLRAIEQRFLDGVSTESISAIHRQVTEHPHIAGSARSMEVADRVRRALDAAGLQTEVREYLVHLSTPRSINVDIVAPSARIAGRARAGRCRRIPIAAHPELGPAFVAYSASGTVTGAGRLRQLRPAARLRAARRGRRRRARQDRHRALRAQPSRREDPHRGAGRRGRHHHLFRSGRRWLRARIDVAGGPLARGLPVAERQRQVQLVLARRSADARRRRDAGRAGARSGDARRRCRRFPPWCSRGRKPRRSCRELAGSAGAVGLGIPGRAAVHLSPRARAR